MQQVRVSPKDDPVYERPVPAICVLADALGIDHEAAERGLKALVIGGYVIAPRLPTNAMLDAYLRAYGTAPSTPRSAIIGIGKARVRWAAMADKGTQMALSWRRVPDHKCDTLSATPFAPCDEHGVTADGLS